jgi:uncharacterized protein YyaL (SSP411 family)
MSQEDMHHKANRLVNEKSPYLLQHAHNPVDWYPWGDEAFDKARTEDRPIFLSIGYSTCHWCHVMERESFEDTEVADLLNQTFVCIKVDREERPDIDSAYMSVCQMMTGSGGWPLTILMTHEKKPFYATTYIPKQSRFGRLGMLEFVPKIRKLWETRRDEIFESAENIIGLVQKEEQTSVGESIGESTLHIAFTQLSDSFDEEHGGFGTAPKFPTPHHLTFLLRYYRRTGNKRALKMVEKTLSAMRLGGIYDHIGFGFHRYSTDAMWFLPHFEKMLYDQAMLAMAYLECYQVTGDRTYEATSKEIFEWVIESMQSQEGGFYSALDADSEGEEGKFYVWREEEVRQALDSDDARLAIKVFNVKESGNYVEETGGHTGMNVLYLEQTLSEIAEVAADYIVKDGQLMIDAPVGDTYFDLKGYELTGDFTIEIKFRFSSERCDNPGNFMTIFHRPEEDYISWWDSEGIGVSMRHWDSMMSVYDLKNGTTLDLWEVLWGSDIYDIDHVIKLKIEGSMLYVYFDDMEVISSSFDFGVPISEFPHGGFSFKVYYSIVAFDYIKIYR